jgi:hypothetical protein
LFVSQKINNKFYFFQLMTSALPHATLDGYLEISKCLDLVLIDK